MVTARRRPRGAMVAMVGMLAAMGAACGGAGGRADTSTQPPPGASDGGAADAGGAPVDGGSAAAPSSGDVPAGDAAPMDGGVAGASAGGAPAPAETPPPAETYAPLDRVVWTASLQHGGAGPPVEVDGGHVFVETATGGFPLPSDTYLHELDATGHEVAEHLLGACLGLNLLGQRPDGNLVLSVPSGCTPTTVIHTVQERTRDGALLAQSGRLSLLEAALARDGSVFWTGQASQSGTLGKLGADLQPAWELPGLDASHVRPLGDGGAVLALSAAGSLRRITSTGAVVWEQPLEGGVWSVAAQPDGASAVRVRHADGGVKLLSLAADGSELASAEIGELVQGHDSIAARPGGGWVLLYRRSVAGQSCEYLRAYSPRLEVLWDGGLGERCSVGNAWVFDGREHVLVTRGSEVLAVRP